MGRAPCCDKGNVKKGPWSPEEDAKLKSFIDKFGTGGNWIALPQKIGLKRCGKSCRLRWLNYLRPNIKHGGFSQEEETIICNLYCSIGSRWSLIAAQLRGRTDNDIKNYWNTKLKKKVQRRDQKPPYPYLYPKQEEDENVIKWECDDNNNTFIKSTNSFKHYSQSVSLYPETACNYWEETQTILPNIHHQSVVKSEENDGISAMLSSSNTCGFDSVVKDDSPQCYYYYNYNYNFFPDEFQEDVAGGSGYKNILCRTWGGSEDINAQLPSASPAFSGYEIGQNNATELLPDYTVEKFGMQHLSSVHEW